MPSLCSSLRTTYASRYSLSNIADESEVQVDTVAEYGEHATQILWKSTTEMGCAVETCDLGDYTLAYVVCQYNPA